jgi:hypothetical protein
MAKLNLPGLENKIYWERLRRWAELYGSDGCTGVPEYYHESCVEHDYHYRYAKTMYGDDVSFEQANQRFRDAIQMRSRLRWFSPVSWVRWLGVKYFGKHIWNAHRERNLQPPFIP